MKTEKSANNNTAAWKVLLLTLLAVLPVSLRAGDTLPGRDTAEDWRVGLRSNLLVPGLNIGVQVPVSTHFSVAADWYYPWFWPSRDQLRCTELLGLGLEARYWFRDGSDPSLRCTGPSLGVGMMAGYYDLGRRGSGIQGEYALAELDYGYVFRIFRNRFRLMLGIGVGWLHTRYRTYEVYEPGGRPYRVGEWSDKLDWVGPVRAEVSLLIPLWRQQKKEVEP